jgi:hypothetical protein
MVESRSYSLFGLGWRAESNNKNGVSRILAPTKPGTRNYAGFPRNWKYAQARTRHTITAATTASLRSSGFGSRGGGSGRRNLMMLSFMNLLLPLNALIRYGVAIVL